MKRTFLVLALLSVTAFSNAQSNPDPVIRTSAIVSNIPNNSQGFLVLKGTGDVTAWEVEVLQYFEDGELLETPSSVTKIRSEGDLDYVNIPLQYFQNNDYSFKISGLNANNEVVVEEDHTQSLIGDPVSELLDCSLQCEGSDYAWRLKVYENINSGSQSLNLDHGFALLGNNQGTASTPFYENIPNDAQGQAYFNTQAYLRSVNITNFTSNEWMLLTNNGTLPPKDKNNTPITTSGYYKLLKEAGKWRDFTGGTGSTGWLNSPANGTFCSYTLSGLINTFNAYSAAVPAIGHFGQDTLALTCDGKAHTGNENSGGPAGGGMTPPSGNPYATDFVPCENGYSPFEITVYYDSVSGCWESYIFWDWSSYTQDLSDCFFGNNVVLPGEEPIFPGVLSVNIVPVTVRGGAMPDAVNYDFVEGGENFPTSLPEGLYMIKNHYGDGFFTTHFAEVMAPASGGRSMTNSDLPAALANVSISPNPASDGVEVSLGDEATGTIQIITGDGSLLETVNFKNTSSVNISVSDYPQGVYWLRIQSSDGFVTKKMIKK
ncbi:MAG: hypothetical protein ACI837_000238 [Crocinitomicaceae bacterium]|jgi:hypothetical protein